MKLNKTLLFGIFFLIVFSSFTLASYSVSNYQFVSPSGINSFVGSASAPSVNFDSKMCQSGKDFLIRVVPGGCTPPVVRSDLLEEQDVPVFCQLQALKLNPLVTINSIESISSGPKYPRGISTIDFIPNYPALGLNRKLSNGNWNNIGYAVIFLNRNKNESSMPDYIKGGLFADLRYTLKNSLGLRNYQFYLPVMSDSKYKELQGQYSFFNHMGYLRADDVQKNSASISIYSAVNENHFGGGNGVQKQRLLNYNLNVGEESPSFFLPGFGCLASSSIKLDSVKGQDTRAILKVNSETFEVKKGESFYDGKCTVVSDPLKEGLRESVEVSCRGDKKSEDFTLRIEPKIKLKINGSEKDYQVGDPLYTEKDKTIYLGYVGTDPNVGAEKITNSLIYLVAVPGKPVKKLDSDTLEKVSRIAENNLRDNKNMWDFERSFFGTLAHTYDWMFDRNNFERLNYGSSKEIFGKMVKIESFAVGTNLDLKNQTLVGYKNNAIESYKQIQESFPNEKYPENSLNSLGEKSLSQLINLSNILNQKEDLKKYCDLFNSKYPKSILDISPCEGIPKYSNVGVSTHTILMGGDYKEISFDGIHKPSFKDYGIELNIRKNGNVLQVPLKMRKGDIIYLDGLFKMDKSQIFSIKNAIGSAKVYIKFDSSRKKWVWSMDKINWMDSSVYIVSGGAFDKQKLSGLALQGISSLNGEDFSGGRIKILKVQGVDNRDFIKLNEIVDETHADINFNLQNQSTLSSVGSFLSSKDHLLELNVPFNIGGTDYTFILTKVNLKRVAKVSINTYFKRGSKVNFNFTIGIEKRLIQLSPEETKSRIESLNKKIALLKKISSSLGTGVKTFKTACEVTGAILTAKNLLLNSGSESVARREVMRGEDGWNSKCESLKVGTKVYSTKEQCLFDNSNEIEKQVTQISDELDNQNKELKNLQKIKGVTTSGGIFGQDVVNQNALMEKGYSEDIKNSLSYFGSTLENPEDPSQTVDINKIEEVLTGENLGKKYTLDDAKKIELYSNLASKYPDDSTYKKRLFTLLYGIQINSKDMLEKKSFLGKYGLTNREGGLISTDKNLQEISVGNLKTFSQIKDNLGAVLIPKIDEGPFKGRKSNQLNIKDNEFVYPVKDKSDDKSYLLVLDNDYVVTRTFEIKNDGTLSLIESSINPLKLSFKKIDESENTPIKNFKIKYYETDPYKGLPALVPVDIKNGWYAYIPQVVSASSSSRSYDLSGRINSFWICNAGSNGVVEYNPMNDDCQFINLGNKNTFSNIGSLSKDDSINLINKAVNNIQKVSTDYKNGVKRISLWGEFFDVGTPAINSPTAECTDVMSPSDCKILFNACDPVICPSSRCDYGGEYPVRNVIQSGVIGSVMLCLPNWNEGIKVPICLSGVKAGVDNFLSVAESYRKCLNTSLSKGETTGICDEINSIYTCEFFWRQSLPLLNLAVPKIDSLIFGGGAKGGGEYIGGIQGALENAKDSAKYLVQYYSLNAESAFKARSQKEVGSMVCKNFLSVVYPQGQAALESLTQSKSPPQFTAKFDVIPFSSVTYPPQSQYKVFFHIFAGNAQGAYYRVYLKGDGSSYFNDATISRLVDSGYISPGRFKTKTVDFTADEGYKQLCVQVNNQEECGFGTVSTNFAVNYLGDQYIKDQANMKKITSQSECQSGSPNLMALLNPNLEAGVSKAVSPNLASEGITRVCATKNPGIKNDIHYPGPNQRWVDVGYCGNVKMRCWIDKQSVVSPNVFNFKTNAKETLKSLGSLLKENLAKQNGLLTDNQFNSKLNEIKKENSPFKKISIIEEIYDKVFGGNQKAYLLFLRGNIYKDLAISLYNKLGLNKIAEGKSSKENLNSCISPNACFLTSAMGCSGEVYSSKKDCPLEGFKCCSGGSTFLLNPQKLELNSLGQNLCFKFFDESWHWRIGCADKTPSTINKQNMNLRFSDNPWNSVGKLNKKGNILEGENLYFINNFEGDYAEGLKYLIEKAGKDNLLLYNYKDTVEMNGKKIFEIKNLESNGDSVYFQYTVNKWTWSFDKEKWTEVPKNYIQAKNSGLLTMINSIWSKITGSTPSSEIKISNKGFNLLKILDGKDFISGAEILFSGDYSSSSIPGKNLFSQTVLNNNCKQYYPEIKSLSEKYDVDPSLILAIMYQESKCNHEASSGSSIGLMQVNIGEWCGKLGLPSDKEECKNVLINNPNKNIDIGIQILKKDYYGDSDKIYFNGCNVKNIPYVGWKAALRRYNGLGCNKNYPSQDYYVENVISIFNKLKSLNIFGQTASNENKILNVAREYLGKNIVRDKNGKPVKDFVCATFVSTVLVKAGVLPNFNKDTCDVSKTSQLQSVENLNNKILPESGNFIEVKSPNWKSNLKPGDIIIWGCQPLSTKGGASYCDSNEFQHITIFEKYDGDNYQVIHEGGEFLPVERKTYSVDGGWYITHVWRASESSISPDSNFQTNLNLLHSLNDFAVYDTTNPFTLDELNSPHYVQRVSQAGVFGGIPSLWNNVFGGDKIPSELKPFLEKINLYHELKSYGNYNLVFKMGAPNGDKTKSGGFLPTSLDGETPSLDKNPSGEITILPRDSFPKNQRDEYESTIYHELVHAKQYYDLWAYGQNLKNKIPEWKVILYLLKNKKVRIGGYIGEELEAYFKQIVYMKNQGLKDISVNQISGYFLFSLEVSKRVKMLLKNYPKDKENFESILNLVSSYDSEIKKLTGYNLSSFIEGMNSKQIREGGKIPFK